MKRCDRWIGVYSRLAFLLWGAPTECDTKITFFFFSSQVEARVDSVAVNGKWNKLFSFGLVLVRSIWKVKEIGVEGSLVCGAVSHEPSRSPYTLWLCWLWGGQPGRRVCCTRNFFIPGQPGTSFSLNKSVLLMHHWGIIVLNFPIYLQVSLW